MLSRGYRITEFRDKWKTIYSKTFLNKYIPIHEDVWVDDKEFIETMKKMILIKTRQDILSTISFYLGLVFMALVLSTCSGDYQEQPLQHLDNFSMQVHCPISLQVLKLEGCELKTMILPSNQESSGM